MKKILVFGAGKSATVLISYLLEQAATEIWHITVVDADLNLAKNKIGNSPFATAISFDINSGNERSANVSEADIVISLMPPHLHILIAKECLRQNKNLLTASYIDDAIRELETEINNKGVLFLYEMGLDPGIDHMSAMQIIDEIRKDGGKITSFKSHCGGLVAPESDDNPWHYKISWNPRNIVMAGKAGAIYKEDGKEITLPYEELFDPERLVAVPALDIFSWYPNRDSLSYTQLYNLTNADTFVRTTLRHRDFSYGWNNLIELNFTKEEPLYDSDGKTLQQLFKEHLNKQNFSEWSNRKIGEKLAEVKAMAENLNNLTSAEEEAETIGEEMRKSFMTASDSGDITEINIDKTKINAAGYIAYKMHQVSLTLEQLVFLGLNDDSTLVNKGKCSPADLLQFAMEKKLALQPNDKDMIVMMHEIEYENAGKKSAVNSSLIVKGDNSLRTAMAKTVGLPLGIAAKLILNGMIKVTGLHIPTAREIYEPVLKELALLGIQFHEDHKTNHR